jgi:general secretion pathway protein B
MSFILDALKKSESERHRQSGPVLMDVRIAPPRRRIPPWAWVIAAVLVVNLGVLAWILWLSPGPRRRTPPMPMATAPASHAHASGGPASSPRWCLRQRRWTRAPRRPLPPAPLRPSPRRSRCQTAPPPSEVTALPAAQNIDVSTLPKVSDMLAAGVVLPQLQLSWHVYDAVPSSRYVLLNGARLREGDSTSDGVRVAAIAPHRRGGGMARPAGCSSNAGR